MRLNQTFVTPEQQQQLRLAQPKGRCSLATLGLLKVRTRQTPVFARHLPQRPGTLQSVVAFRPAAQNFLKSFTTAPSMQKPDARISMISVSPHRHQLPCSGTPHRPDTPPGLPTHHPLHASPMTHTHNSRLYIPTLTPPCPAMLYVCPTPPTPHSTSPNRMPSPPATTATPRSQQHTPSVPQPCHVCTRTPGALHLSAQCEAGAARSCATSRACTAVASSGCWLTTVTRNWQRFCGLASTRQQHTDARCSASEPGPHAQ